MVINTPSMLETGLLDVDGRVERSKRPNGNAWKAFTVWRWSENLNDENDDRDLLVLSGDVRGGREIHGTLFYLRGCFYHDQ